MSATQAQRTLVADELRDRADGLYDVPERKFACLAVAAELEATDREIPLPLESPRESHAVTIASIVQTAFGTLATDYHGAVYEMRQDSMGAFTLIPRTVRLAEPKKSAGPF